MDEMGELGTMKKFEEIIKQKSVLLNDWEGKEKVDVLSDFEEKKLM